LAVALGNASLIGVGYLMVRRRRWFAVAALAVTLVRVVGLGPGASPSDEVAMLLYEYGYDDSEPPQDDSVEVSKPGIRDAFRPLVVR
jgi:hypothetical protein